MVDINENENESKYINISGTNNKYHMNKLIQKKKEIKIRVTTHKWTFSNDYYNYSKQMQVIKDIQEDILKIKDIQEDILKIKDIQEDVLKIKDTSKNVTKIVVNEINKKIYGYKQQDKIKKLFNESNFITFESIIYKMNECQLICRYCKNEMNVLYDISREMKQWTVDRIDNNQGHNNDNFHLACLECNLKRRRRSDEHFLFTSQLNIVKMD
jgi:hypothetical protein